MNNQTENDKILQTKITADEISRLRLDIKAMYKSSVEPVVDGQLKKTLELIKTPHKTKQQQKELNELVQNLVYPFLLDNGTLLSNIPRKREKQYGLLAIRERLIAEYNCQTAAELILVDEVAAAYWRLMKYESYANKLPEKDEGYSFDQLTVNVIKEARQQIEQAHRQINLSLTQLKDLKQPPLKVNVKADNAYFAQNQQIVNEKTDDKPPVETISAK